MARFLKSISGETTPIHMMNVEAGGPYAVDRVQGRRVHAVGQGFLIVYDNPTTPVGQEHEVTNHGDIVDEDAANFGTFRYTSLSTTSVNGPNVAPLSLLIVKNILGLSEPKERNMT